MHHWKTMYYESYNCRLLFHEMDLINSIFNCRQKPVDIGAELMQTVLVACFGI